MWIWKVGKLFNNIQMNWCELALFLEELQIFFETGQEKIKTSNI